MALTTSGGGGGMMIDVCEITMNGRNRIAFKKTLAGVLYCELLRPGELRDGHGWIVSDSVFLEHSHVENLRKLLAPGEVQSASHPC